MADKKKPVIDYESCMACGICAGDCPLSCIALRKTDIDRYQKAYPVLDEYYRCTGCTRCAKTCPMEAIGMM
ncbi:4Fe-4S binding protein [uncultured Acetobacterium sp.]|uniref:4Fe-4S binding protein n=1 Tax=uncultured Acetobacterium sp. TaxID=217139 RepID=UPI0025DDB7F5|nr:4Fe-4S binding protein [uncultured Acetobacterium sp.]